MAAGTRTSYLWIKRAPILTSYGHYLRLCFQHGPHLPCHGAPVDSISRHGPCQCATRRLVVSRVQLGGTWREVLGSDGLPGSERVKGTTACQETSGRVQAYEAARWGTRVIWRKLDCLHPNLQEAKSSRPPERRLKPVPCPVSVAWHDRYNLRGVERFPVREFKEMSGAPKSRYDVQRGRTWDRLTGASPMATEAP